MGEEAYPDALPAGFRLHWYVLEHVLGQGGFGITYLARDTNLDRRVAIKEYLPSEIARRRSDAAAHPRTEAQADRYTAGLDRFLAEARTLARFTHPNIVQVQSVFEAHNTAYMVMRFEEGENLARLLDRSGTLTENQLLDMLLPILDGLQLVHSAGFIHRDIKPANIYIRQDGTPVLLDFGSARQSFGSAKTMTILVAPGYAPLEQYYSEGATQGAWTDIYGLGATCYRAIAGRAPQDAVVRAKGVLGSAREVLQPAVEVGRGRYSQQVLAAVDHALQLSERDRPQDVASWRAEILPASAAPRHDAPQALPGSAAVLPTPAPAPAAAPDHVQTVAPPRPATRAWWPAAASLAAVGGLLVAVVQWRAPPPPSQPLPAPALAALPSAAMPAPSAPPAAVTALPAAPTTAPSTSGPAATPELAAVTARPPEPRRTDTPSRPLAPAKPAAGNAPPVQAKRGVAPGAELATAQPSTALQAVADPLPVASVSAAQPSPQPSPQPSTQRPPPAAASAAASMIVAVASVPDVNPRSARNEQIEAADAAFRRGDHATAAQLLSPWAAAGVTRAQLLLGLVREAATGRLHSDFQAYVWFGVAARAGEPGAQALRDKVAPRLQPAEIQQADQAIARFRNRPEAAATGNP